MTTENDTKQMDRIQRTTLKITWRHSSSRLCIL